MKPMTFERTIAAQVDQVWAITTDVDRYAERFAGVDAAVLLTGGDFAMDTRWRETCTVYGRSATVEIRVIQAKALHRYTTEARVGARAITEFVFVASADAFPLCEWRLTCSGLGNSPKRRFLGC